MELALWIIAGLLFVICCIVGGISEKLTYTNRHLTNIADNTLDLERERKKRGWS